MTNLVALDARRRANAILRRLPPTPAAVIAERRMVLLDAAYPVQHRSTWRQRRAQIMREAGALTLRARDPTRHPGQDDASDDERE